VGALILAALGLLIAFVFLLGDFRFGAVSEIAIDFRNSGDLKVGAPVKVSGVTVGKVTEVRLWGGRPDPEHEGRPVYVRARVRIDPDALAMLHEDARFTISTLGVLGERYVEIDPGSQDKPRLAEGAVVVGTSPMSLESVAAEAGALMADVKALVGENREDIRAIVTRSRETIDHVDDLVVGLGKDARAVTARVGEIAGGLATAVGDGTEIRRLVADLRTFTAALDREVVPVLPEFRVVAAKLEKTLDAATEVATEAKALVAGDIRQAVANVKVFTEALRDPRGTVGALLSDRQLYDDIVAFVKDIKRHPWRILRKE